MAVSDTTSVAKPTDQLGKLRKQIDAAEFQTSWLFPFTACAGITGVARLAKVFFKAQDFPMDEVPNRPARILSHISPKMGPPIQFR